MAENKKIVRFWRGTRDMYNSVAAAGLLSYWTRYTVKESDGTWTEYYGSNRISNESGQLLPVIDVVANLPETLNPGDRYLVGHDASEGINAEYYIAIIDVDTTALNGLNVHTEQLLNNSGKSVRVINRGSKAYQLVDGILTTYDEVNCGEY